MNLFILYLFKDPRYFFITLIVIVFSICLHEFFHAWTALKLGDTTAADRGHLTLNPLKQMGPFSIIMFLMLGFAWGAVPVDNYVLRARNRHAPAIVALAGPATNFGLFLIGFFFFGFLHPRIWNLVENKVAGQIIVEFFFYLGAINLFLCIFNLLPIPGLDGWAALKEYLPALMKKIQSRPGMQSLFSSEFAKGVTIFLIVLFLILGGRISILAAKIMDLAPGLFGAE